MRRPPAPAAGWWLSAAALALAVGAAPWLQARMASHMLIQLPLLVLSGALASAVFRGRDYLAKVDSYGVTGLTALLFISAYWMIPRALELSLTSDWVAAAKCSSLWLLGWALPGSLRRAPWVVQTFYLGNFGAMMAIAGIQYQNLPQRLCNAYLLDDQDLTGIGLTVAAVLLSLVWAKAILNSAQPGGDVTHSANQTVKVGCARE